MKTPSAASRALCYPALCWGIVVATPLSAQVSYNYNQPPPPGYPAAGTTPKTSTRATRQAAATVQAPAVYPPSYPTTYPPPPGYTYPPPPGQGIKPAAKPTASTKSTSKSSSSSKKSPAGPPPPPSSGKVYGPTGDLSTQVAKLRDSDKVQNLRLGDLERDVSSIKRGGKSSSRYDGGTDLAAHTTYVARPGDTLFRIASTHRVSVGEIQQLNRMTEDEVRVGQTLLIPSPHRLSSALTQASYKPATPGIAPATTTTTTSSLSYTVKKGDSLKAIAIKHKTTTAALASANRIKDPNKIVVGQRLKIPGRTVSIAATPRSTPSSQQSSETVPLPGFGMNEPPPPAAGLAPATSPAAPAGSAAATTDSHRGILAYRVDGSDTLETIAQQFSTTPQHIREMNRMDANMKLKNGDEIMVPAMGAVSVSR